MRQVLYFVLIVCFSSIISGCGNSPEIIANTQPPTSTETPTKTYTPLPTATIENTPTNTPTEIPTETPAPESPYTVLFVESDRGMISGKMTVTYAMIVTGFEPNEKFFMEFYKYMPGDLGGERREFYTEGFLLVKSVESGEAFTPGLQGFAPGEPFRVSLMNADGDELASARIVPMPLEVRGQDECVLSIIIGNSTGEIFHIEGAGFEPNEEIEFTSVSEGETIPSTVLIESDGTFENILLPAVVGKDSGNASVAAKGMNCDLYLEYAWGAAAFDQ